MEKKKIEIALNKSSTYFLSYVDLQVKFEFLNLIKNTYLTFNGQDDNFCVLYEWSSDPKFTKFESDLMEHTLFERHEDYGKYVLYEFRLTRNMQDARKLFVNGKYSMFSPEHKNSIVAFLKKRGYTNAERIKKILYRDEDIRNELDDKLKVKIDPNNELSSPPNMNDEKFSNHIDIIKYKIDDFK